MGEDCCGGAAVSGPDVQLPNGGAQKGKAQANGLHKPVESHQEAARRLQDFIAKRIQLFETYHERELQQVGPGSDLHPLAPPECTALCLWHPGAFCAPSVLRLRTGEPLQRACQEQQCQPERCRWLRHARRACRSASPCQTAAPSPPSRASPRRWTWPTSSPRAWPRRWWWPTWTAPSGTYSGPWTGTARWSCTPLMLPRARTCALPGSTGADVARCHARGLWNTSCPTVQKVFQGWLGSACQQTRRQPALCVARRETPSAAQAFWHSSSHVLGEALEACFGVLLTIGPAIEEGFYYDCCMAGRSLTEAERPVLEGKIKQARCWHRDEPLSSRACMHCAWSAGPGLQSLAAQRMEPGGALPQSAAACLAQALPGRAARRPVQTAQRCWPADRVAWGGRKQHEQPCPCAVHSLRHSMLALHGACLWCSALQVCQEQSTVPQTGPPTPT